MKLRRIVKARPSPAMAVAIAALFVGLGGTAWAVATVGPQDIQDDAVRARHIATGSVFSGHVANETIRSGDLDDGGVLSRDIRDASVRGADVAPGSLTGATLQNGSVTGAQVRESSLGEVPAAAAADNVLAARVSNTGALTNVRGATEADRHNEGVYTVGFDRNVLECAYTATGDPGNGRALGVQSGPFGNDSLTVLTGTPETGFSIVVVC